MKFYNKLQNRWQYSNSFLCVGLDVDVAQIPASLGTTIAALLDFNKAIIDAVAPYVCAFKLQIAYYSAYAAEQQLAETIDYIKAHYPDIPIILDAKRGDIGATAVMYAREAFERYAADAVTVNPYMGSDSLQPFLDYADKGVFILCRTSNPGSHDIQQLRQYEKQFVYNCVAELAVNKWNHHGNVGLVVGGTYPQTIKEIRAIAGDMPLLVPGIGAQGGDLDAVMHLGMTSNQQGLVINASRSIIYASIGDDFAEAAANEAKRLAKQMQIYIEA